METKEKKYIIFFILLVLLSTSCNKTAFQAKWINEIAPDTFVSRFETSKGSFDIRVKREYSPKAVDRYYQLLKHNYYNNAVFYRVVPNFVAQFGSTDTANMARWTKFKVPDEKTIFGNKKGTICFARAGKETRGKELFINLADNSRLDFLDYGGVAGFPAFGEVIHGMEVVEMLYSGYSGNTMQMLDTLYSNRTRFFTHFPKLDTIKKAYILKKE